MIQLPTANRILALFGFPRRQKVRDLTPLEVRHGQMRRAARTKLEAGLLPWNAPTLERKREIDHADLIARELGISQVRVLEHIPAGHDQITVKKHGVILERRSYPSTGEVFGGLQ